MRIIQRRRMRWNRDLVVTAELGQPVATDATTATAVMRVADTHVERHRRRWGRVR